LTCDQKWLLEKIRVGVGLSLGGSGAINRHAVSDYLIAVTRGLALLDLRPLVEQKAPRKSRVRHPSTGSNTGVAIFPSPKEAALAFLPRADEKQTQ
jgi:hypothetical protein